MNDQIVIDNFEKYKLFVKDYIELVKSSTIDYSLCLALTMISPLFEKEMNINEISDKTFAYIFSDMYLRLDKFANELK